MNKVITLRNPIAIVRRTQVHQGEGTGNPELDATIAVWKIVNALGDAGDYADDDALWRGQCRVLEPVLKQLVDRAELGEHRPRPAYKFQE